MIEELSLEQFLSQFETEEACAEYLFQIKWPNGFVCPRCQHRVAYRIATRRLPLFQCAHCHHQTSLTVATVMEGSRTPLRKWLIALFLVSHISSGISAMKLGEIIEVTYKTAWLMLHKIRSAMGEADASVRLSGIVCVNTANYGRRPQSNLNRHPQEHPLFVAASITDQDTPIYAKMKRIPKIHLDMKRVLRTGNKDFTKNHVEPHPQTIEYVTEPYKPIRFKKLYPFFIEAKRWINQTFHGLGFRHLNAYLNEFCYRLNRRLENTSIFESLASLCMSLRKISYSELIRYR